MSSSTGDRTIEGERLDTRTFSPSNDRSTSRDALSIARRGQINCRQLRRPRRGHGLWFIVARSAAKHHAAKIPYESTATPRGEIRIAE